MIPVNLFDVRTKQSIWSGLVHDLPIQGASISLLVWPEDIKEGEEVEPTEVVYMVLKSIFGLDSRINIAASPITIQCVEIDLATGKPKENLVKPANIIPHGVN